MCTTTDRTFYAVRHVGLRRWVYQGHDLDDAAEALEPGTVFGSGENQGLANIEAMLKESQAQQQIASEA